MSDIFAKLQAHTINIYGLKGCAHTIATINARELLNFQRFDLYAKLFYIENYHVNKELATKVYEEHIHAFNPDFREPGRDDKNSCDDFIISFDKIIAHFREHDFDDNVSIVPVDRNGIILDGAHRIAALAFYNKNVTIAKFADVTAKCKFDYKYFLNRGLKSETADLIALEMTKWTKNVRFACLWPRIGKQQQKDIATHYLSESFKIGYIKDCHLNLKSLEQLISFVYFNQDWVSQPLSVKDKALNCYGNSSSIIRFAVLATELDNKQIIAHKESLRNMFGYNKHSIHITDTDEEAVALSNLVFSEEGRVKWLTLSNYLSILSFAREKWLYFKKVKWINFKSIIYKFIFR